MRLGKSLCPYLKKTSAAQLRALSTSPVATAGKTAKGTPLALSNSMLYSMARACPVMGSAIEVRQASHVATGSAKRAYQGSRNFSSSTKCPFPHDTMPVKAAHVEHGSGVAYRGPVAHSEF